MSLKEQGKTIFFNSHILADVEQICDRLAILSKGEIICTGTLSALLGSDNRYQAIVYGGDTNQLQKWLPDLQDRDGKWVGHVVGKKEDFIASVSLMGAQLIDLKLARPTLEEFFITQIRAHDPNAHFEEHLEAIAR